MDQGTVPLPLKPSAILGFNGHVLSGLKLHPDQDHLIYPLGSNVIIKSLSTGKQSFLQGHSNNVSCIAVSSSGRLLASGQVTFMGFKADVFIWDFEKRDVHSCLRLHKAKVEAVSFSPNEQYMVSLGGRDDNSIVLWSVESKEPICSSAASPPSTGHCLTVLYSNLCDEVFISAGVGTLRVWELDLHKRKIRATDCQTGIQKRTIKTLEIPRDDSCFYCGTTSGDIMKVNLKTKLMASLGPATQKFGKGVTALQVLRSDEALVGSGDGMLTMCSGTSFKNIKSVRLEGGVTSIVSYGDGQPTYIGTDQSNIYSLDYSDFRPKLIATNHSSSVKDLAFPVGTSEIFATCSLNEIRVWHNETFKELLRIMVPNITCNALGLMKDGSNIFSGWNDGKIRLFTPESGKQQLIIHNAHSMEVTAIAATSDCKKIISGGKEGQVSMWKIFESSYQLTDSVKEHKASINCIKIRSDDKECVTASADGACIVWQLEVKKFVRKQMVLANTQFSVVCYHPEEHQIITSGTDRKISYWEMFDGSVIRELDGSPSGAINDMHISEDGKFFVTGGDDRLLRLWMYDEGRLTHIGSGHSGSVTKIQISPDGSCFLSSSADGAVLKWTCPENFRI